MKLTSVMKFGFMAGVMAGTVIGAVYFYKHKGGFFAANLQAINGVQDKIEELRRIDEMNQRLTLENQKLRSLLEEKRFDRQVKEQAHIHAEQTHETERKTGTSVGRTIASLHYEIPKHLLPSQIYVLGMDYLDRHQDEKAAVIFHYLTHLENNNDYKNAQSFLLAGSAWYRIDNYKEAIASFNTAQSYAKKESDENAMAQSRLWRAIASSKMAGREVAQEQLRELIEHHPHSKEAKWVNPAAQ